MIVVLGGGGFVGRHLLTRLAAGLEPVRATVRPQGEAAPPVGRPIEVVPADVRDPRSLASALAGARAVVNLVTLIDERRRGDFAAVHHRGMENLVAAARAAGVRRVLHVGALAPEDCRRDPRRRYLYWKQRGTDALLASGLDATVFESSIVFGPGDQQLTAIALVLRYLPFVPVPGRAAAATRFQPVWVGDLVSCLVAALGDPATAGRVLPVGGPEVFTYRQLVALVSRRVGRRRPVVLVPRWSVRLVLSTLRRLLAYLPVSSALVDLIGVDSVADSRATWEAFGIVPARLSEESDYLRAVGRAELAAWRRRAVVDGAARQALPVSAVRPGRATPAP